MSLKITNIQRFSLHDGPGIRTTVFLKGCSIRCPWCCNPENISDLPQFYFNSEDCIHCRECSEVCPVEILKEPRDVLTLAADELAYCFKCRKCVEGCPTGALGIYGEKISEEDLMSTLEMDREYYIQTGGGVTFSGGEPLLQADELLNIFKTLREKDIHIAVETSLFAPVSCLDIIIDSVDLFIIDVKILDAELADSVLHANLEEFKTNFQMISRKNMDMIIRFPMIKPFTFNRKNIDSLMDFIGDYNIKYIEIFTTHQLAAKKYDSLGWEMKKQECIKEEEIKELIDELEDISVEVKSLNFN